MVIPPSTYALGCVFLTLIGLGISNDFEVKSTLPKRLGVSHLQLFVACMPGRTAALGFAVLVCFAFFHVTSLRPEHVLGLAVTGCVIGYAINVPFLMLSVATAQTSVFKLQLAAKDAMHNGYKAAIEEIEAKTQDRRLWPGCLKIADEDPEMAATYYLRRRQRQFARERILSGGEWSGWVPTSAIVVNELLDHLEATDPNFLLSPESTPLPEVPESEGVGQTPLLREDGEHTS
jgi:hypothetical protein